MNALIKKEIRLLLPGFLVSAVTAIAGWIVRAMQTRGSFSESDFATHQCWFLFVPLLLMALSAFGREFNSGTFSVLLAQPASRKRLWRAKSLSLAGMAGLIISLWGLLWVMQGSEVYHFPNGLGHHSETHGNAYVWISVALGALAVCSGGLWTVLLFRQVAAALWITLLTPLGLFVTVNALLENQPSGLVNRVLGSLFLLYGISGIAFARWLFLRAQDAQWTGADQFRLPDLGWLARHRGGERRVRRPYLALLRKEFQLYHVLCVMAAVLCLTHLGVLAMRKFGHFETNSAVKAVMETFWVLWMAMPVLIGATAVSEERKIGALEGQLCLPVERRTQFELKFIVLLLLAIGLGIGMPLILEGKRILPEGNLNEAFYADLSNDPGLWVHFVLYVLSSISANLPWISLIVTCCGLAAMAFYASTLARNTLEALGLAALGILGAGFLSKYVEYPEEFIRVELWRGPLIYLIGAPSMLLVLAGLGYWNYKRVHVGWNVWRRNLSVLALALAMVGVFTATIYRCPWELLAPVDSIPGPVRISAGPAGSGLPVVRTYSFGVPSLKILIVLPDGRVWVNRFCAQVTPSLDRKLVQDPLFGGGRFIQGSDWKCADLFRGTLIAIRRDGSLWISDSIEAERSPLAAREIKMNQIGTEKDWKGLSSGSFPGYLVKNDGTLWCWRFHEGFGFGPTAPYQVGSDSDWDGFQRFDDWRTVCRKINGEAWVYSSRKENKPEIRLTENMSLFREPALEKKGCKDIFLFQTDHNGSLFSAGVCEDGMLREVARPHPDPQSSYEILESQDIQIGTERDWAQVIDSGYYNQPIVRKADGTLWKWSFKAAPHDNPRLCSASRLGTRSDWVAGARNVTLGADGSLWGWSVESELYWPGNSHSLLQGSRRPEYLGNIFGSPR